MDSVIIIFNLACYAALMNKKDLAMKHLERVYELMPEFLKGRDYRTGRVRLDDPDLNCLKSDKRFEEFCRKVYAS